MTRSIPKTLAPVVERLELEQPEVVTLQDLASIAKDLDLRTAPPLLAYRLRERGWLLPTPTRGVWEFAPGARAGPYSRSGPLLALRAALARAPDLPLAVALSSAAWGHGLADRVPPRLELALLPGRRPPAGLERQARILPFESRLEPEPLRGVPVQRFETMLVHMAARPTHVRSWGGVVTWIADVVVEAEEPDLRHELAGRPGAVRIRLAYLLQGMWPSLADELARDKRTKVWFGPRAKLRRHSQRLLVADSILPFDPAGLPQVR